MCSKAKSPLRTRAGRCVSSADGVCLRRAMSPAAQVEYCNIVPLNMQSVCAPVCSAVLLSRLLCCALVWCLTSHMFTGFSRGATATLYLPSPSTRRMYLYDIPLREALPVIFVIFWVRSAIRCTLKRCIFSIGRIPPYVGISPKAR